MVVKCLSASEIRIRLVIKNHHKTSEHEEGGRAYQAIVRDRNRKHPLSPTVSATMVSISPFVPVLWPHRTTFGDQWARFSRPATKGRILHEKSEPSAIHHLQLRCKH